MDKRTLKHLERVFTSEIAGRSCQLHTATMDKLAARGLVTIVTEEFRTGLGTLRVRACRLTHAGRIEYCKTC